MDTKSGRWKAVRQKLAVGVLGVGIGGWVLILGLTAADVAFGVSDVGRNLGRELKSWNTWLLLGVAGLVGLPLLGRRDFAAMALLGGMVLLLGGFAFSPNSIEATIKGLWQAVAP